MFNAEKTKNQCIKWIQDFFEKNGPGCNAVIGISGGKDSAVAAALCTAALGKERVIGVMMPNGVQPDIDYAINLVRHLDIKNYTINIESSVQALSHTIANNMLISEQTAVNLPSRIRMAALYAVSQSNNGRVVNTCNLSEDWVGYSTRYGDSAGDFSPLSNLTVTEVKEIGYLLNLPHDIVDKVPTDGLCNKTDEENLGFTYDVLDNYIRTGICKDEKVKALIDKKHSASIFKLAPMPCFNPEQ